MLRQISDWWIQSGAPIIGRGIDNMVPLFFRPHGKEQLFQNQGLHRSDGQRQRTMRQQLKEFDQDLNQTFLESPKDASVKALSLLEKFQQEHAPDELVVTRRMKQALVARQQERAEVDALYKSAGENNEQLIRDLRDYLNRHLQSDIASAALTGALRSAGNYNEAIALCEERLERYGTDEQYSSIRFGTAATLASLFVERGRSRDAILLLENLLTECPSVDPFMKLRVHIALAEAYEDAKSITGARKAWTNAASFTEYKAFAKMAQERLEQL